MKHNSLITLALASIVCVLGACSEQEENVKNNVPAENAAPSENTVPAAEAAAPEQAMDTVQDALESVSKIEAAPDVMPLDWHDRIEPAIEEAKANGKLLLLEFTGSDWCPPCRILRGRIFPAQEFVDFAKEKFVFVELDFPRNKAVTDETREYNERQEKAFFVQAFPTVYIVDPATGVPVGDVSGVSAKDTPATYVARFAEEYAAACDRITALALARGTQDPVKRAVLLHEIYQAVPATLQRFYRSQLEEEIIAADPSDPFNLVAAHNQRLALEKQVNDFKAFMEGVAKIYAAGRGDPQKVAAADKQVLEALEPILANPELEPRMRQLYLYHVKLPIICTQRNMPAILDTYREIVAIDPNSKEGRDAGMLLKFNEQAQQEKAAAGQQ
ncbi:MAG: thioredoxin family protein [Opitutales bacterium]|nr:thioredoxin family protein [Opitutales bacterium]